MARRVPSYTGRTFPYWIDESNGHTNLRLVGRNLAVGAWAAPREFKGWSGIIDFYGSSREDPEEYPEGASLLRIPFEDGQQFPKGALDTALMFVQAHRKDGPVLFHCAAGLSRSASAAYAMLRVLDGLSHEDALERVQTENTDYPMQATLNSARGWVQRRRI